MNDLASTQAVQAINRAYKFDFLDYYHRAWRAGNFLLRARREGPRRRAAEQRDELASSPIETC